MQKVLCLVLLLLFVYQDYAVCRTSIAKRRVEEIKRSSIHKKVDYAEQEKVSRDISIYPKRTSEEFVEYLMQIPRVYFRDTVDLFALVINGRIPDIPYKDKLEGLSRSGIVDEYVIDKQTGVYITKGILAYMLCRMLRYEGGFMARFFGMNERSALKEAVFRSLLPAGSPGEFVSGEELLFSVQYAVDEMMEDGK